ARARRDLDAHQGGVELSLHRANARGGWRAERATGWGVSAWGGLANGTRCALAPTRKIAPAWRDQPARPFGRAPSPRFAWWREVGPRRVVRTIEPVLANGESRFRREE